MLILGLGRIRHREFAMGAGEMSREAFTAFLQATLGHAAASCRDGAIAFVCMDWRHMGELLAAGRAVFSELKNLCIWNKTNGGMGSFYRSKHELVFVFKHGSAPHTGAGLVIAKLQQRSDVTFRLFDHGRQRELHIESAITVANTGPADFQVQPSRLTDELTLLVSSPHFVFERIDLAPNSAWRLEADCETWFLVLNGGARAGSFDVAIGDAIFVQSDRVDIHAGTIGTVGLAAYAGAGPVPHLLQPLRQPGSMDAGRRQGVQVPTSLTRAKAAPTYGRLEIAQ